MQVAHSHLLMHQSFIYPTYDQPASTDPLATYCLRTWSRSSPIYCFFPNFFLRSVTALLVPAEALFVPGLSQTTMHSGNQ